MECQDFVARVGRFGGGSSRGLLAGSPGGTVAQGADLDRMLPIPLVDETPQGTGMETLTVAGECFWGVQGMFQHVRGVVNAVSGDDGGAAVTWDPVMILVHELRTLPEDVTAHVISYGLLLQIFFSVTTDPTQLNQQYPDQGTQYRSEIFVANPERARIAKAYIAQLDQAKMFPKAIVTKVDEDTGFYPAEAYHQNYLTLHPDSPYIARFDLPKIAALQKVFPAAFRPDPALVAKRGS